MLMADEEYISHPRYRNRKRNRLRNYEDWNTTSNDGGCISYYLSKQQRHRSRRQQRVFDESESNKKKHKSIIICKSCGCCCGGVNKIIPTLPNDVLSEILVRLPADILYFVMRHVCKNWRQIIDNPDFVNAHLHRSSSSSSYALLASHGWLFGPNQDYDQKILANPKRKLSQLHYKWNKILNVDPNKGLVVDSCDGLVLVFSDNGRFRVLNPITNQKMKLPRQRGGPNFSNLINSNIHDIHSDSRPIGALACAKSSKKYKAFMGYATCRAPFQYKISVLTLGVDNSWRNITALEFDGPQSLSSVAVLSVGGFVYFHVRNKTVLLALDAEDETIQHVLAPNHDQSSSSNHITECQYIKSGRFLFSVLNPSFDVYDFWALMDPKNEDWRKLYRVDLNSHKGVQRCVNKFSCCTMGVPRNLLRGRLDQLRPLLVMEEDVVLFYFSVGDSNNNLYVGYKVKTDEFLYTERGCSLMQGVIHLETLAAIQ